jgi:ABC-2 type transport system permease protein
MRWEHLKAFVWLRWRLRFNQVRKGGLFNAIVLGLLAVLGVIAALASTIVMFFVGFLALANATPTVLMFVWDGLVVAYLFVWMMGLVTELQKSESLSLTKFLHLPVSATGVFLINYLSSLFSITLLIFAPAMFALALGLTLSRGLIMLLQIPLVLGLLFMITALTYQFQGWLAALMINPRRRRTIVVVVTMGFVLLAQLPNLANLIGGPLARKKLDTGADLRVELKELQDKLARQEISPQEFQHRQVEIKKEHEEKTRVATQRLLESADQTARLAGLVLPPGWLPLGCLGLAEGGILGALLGTLGMSSIGGISLWRSYRTTLRLYTGQFTSGQRPAPDAVKPAAPSPAEKAIPKGNPLEKEIRWLSEQATVVALSNVRSLLRAPEAKMMLLSPILMIVVFGSIMLTRSAEPPPALRPFMASGAIAMILFTLSQLIGNQFGFDRSGFRVFVLCPAPRRQILLGKNAAAAPLVLVLCLLAVVAVEVVYPMPVDLFISLLPQVLSMFLLYCLIGNLASILAPLRIAPGTMKPTSVKAIPVLAHVGMMLLLPAVLSITTFPLLVHLLFQSAGWLPAVPVAAILSLLECALICVFYYFAVGWEGDLLQAREQKILEAVVNKEE